MGLFDEKKKENQIQDAIKVLSSNVEIINQRLSNTQGFNTEEFHSAVESQVTTINEKVEDLTNSLSQFDSEVRNIIVQDKDEIVKQISDFSENAQSIVDQTQQTLSQVVNEVSGMRKNIQGEFVIMRQIFTGLVHFNKNLVSYLQNPNQQIPSFEQLDMQAAQSMGKSLENPASSTKQEEPSVSEQLSQMSKQNS
ncbi:MAG: hypothetical protein ACMXYF_05555 [Candidatus Woesearchaeota archaeon]